MSFRHRTECMRVRGRFLVLLCSFLLLASCNRRPWPPGVQDVPDASAVLAPDEALETFYLPPGYDIELVAAEPLVQDPVAIDFDADGRLWAVEMRRYMPNVEAEGEGRPAGQIVVLEDTTGDYRMDTRTVYMDRLVLPRALKVLAHGVLVAAPPCLWITQDTTGDLRADTKNILRDDYGDPDRNPEHNANGLMWGLDNWIHSARYKGRLRYRNGTWEYDETLRLGQWGASMDDYGRIYRNYNEDPLRVDLVSAHYFARNPHLTRKRGIYERVYEDKTVWPVRPTPGVNRGYRDPVLREDSSLASYTAAGAPVAYRGDQLPAALRNDVFVTEPAGNLVQRYEITQREDGTLVGENPYERADFLASTDERFRPVNLYSAPDGTLYVVDMYRGVIQHQTYLTGYLKTHIRTHALEKPIGLGRIYRIVHRSTEPVQPSRLSEKSPAEWVEYLEHPNGWWRDTAQRLLVERGDRSVAPALRPLAASGREAYTRLHALWTLDGFGAADPATLRRALSDPSPHVRAAAVRIAELYLRQADHALVQDVMGLLEDTAPVVRWQLAASLGERPSGDRERALEAVLDRHADDPIVVSLVVSGLAGREFAFLKRLLRTTGDETASAGMKDAIETLSVTVLNTDHSAETRAMLAWIGEADRPAWQRLALLAAIGDVAPDPSSGHRRFELDHRPEGILTAMQSTDRRVRERARAVAERLHWPGKPVPERPEVRPLTPEEQRLFEQGRARYVATCAPCHQEDGQGLEGVAPSLVDSDWVLGERSRLIRILLHGLEGDMLMPPMRRLSDAELAAILTYVRRAWGHEASPIDATAVQEVRGVTKGRGKPWTEEELQED